MHSFFTLHLIFVRAAIIVAAAATAGRIAATRRSGRRAIVRNVFVLNDCARSVDALPADLGGKLRTVLRADRSTQAALGAEVDVPTLHGSVKYRIPEGTQPDAEFRIKGEGIKQLRGTGKGDLLFRVRVEVPRKLTEKQRELLEQFDATVSGRQYEAKKTFVDKLKDVFTEK